MKEWVVLVFLAVGEQEEGEEEEEEEEEEGKEEKEEGVEGEEEEEEEEGVEGEEDIVGKEEVRRRVKRERRGEGEGRKVGMVLGSMMIICPIWHMDGGRVEETPAFSTDRRIKLSPSTVKTPPASRFSLL